MAEAVIFDMDGVIVDTEPHADRNLEEFLAKRDHEMPVNFLDSVRGRVNRDICTFVLQNFPLKLSVEELMNELSLSYLDYLKALPKLEPVPGVKNLITGLQKYGIDLAVASSASKRRMKFILDSLGLRETFPVQISGEDIVNGKPAPDIFLKAARRMKINPENCAVIEDSTLGIMAAKRAGMVSVGFTGLPHNKQDLSRADWVIANFTQIQPQFFCDL